MCAISARVVSRPGDGWVAAATVSKEANGAKTGPPARAKFPWKLFACGPCRLAAVGGAGPSAAAYFALPQPVPVGVEQMPAPALRSCQCVAVLL